MGDSLVRGLRIGLVEPVHGSAPDPGSTATDLSSSVLDNLKHPAGGAYSSPTEHLAFLPTSRR